MRHLNIGRKLAVVATSFLAVVSWIGLAFAPAISDQVRPVLQYFGIVSCNSANPCAQDNNKGTGPGIQAQSSLGTGAVGITKSNSTSASNGKSGLFGNDLSASGTFDSGVSGLSVRGTGVSGSSTSGNAMTASSVSGSGLIATSVNSDAIYATSTNFYGIGGLTLNPSKTTGTGYAGVLAQDNSSDGGHLNSGVLGYSVNGFGVAAFSGNWVGANVIGGAFEATTDTTYPALSIVGNNNDLIDACSPGTANPCYYGSAIFHVDGSGDVYTSGVMSAGNGFQTTTGVFVGGQGFVDLSTGNVNISGQYQKNGNCLEGCTVASPTRPGRAVASYVPTQSLPSIDDFGEATLQAGYAYVQIDAAFGNVIDRNADYLVFITPEGDSRGLYVTQKTAQGFVVRENMGGHSSLAFSYRILAKPLGETEQRLPMVTIPKLQRPPNIRHHGERRLS